LSEVAKGTYSSVAKKLTFKLSNALAQIRKDEANTDEIVNIYLTYKGYKALKLQHVAPENKAFRKGIKRIDEGFNKRDSYENAYNDFDILISVASNKGGDLDDILEIIKTQDCFYSIKEERVQLNYSTQGNRSYYKDHFGYVDGISQPKFFPTPGKKNIKASSIATLETVLIGDLGGENVEYSCGSFLAFLQLEQDQDAFKNLYKLISEEAEISELEAQAKIMGRYPNGSPIKDEEEGEKAEVNFDNDFDYHQMFAVDKNGEQKWHSDEEGLKCPLSAHIRKINPRTQGTNYRNKYRIVRRGMPYQYLEEEGNVKSEGLFFMSYQRDLETQFEKLVNTMLHAPLSNNRAAGSDLLTGKKGIPRILKVGEEEIAITPTESLVTLLGGAYFFAPCISFFKNINRFPDIDASSSDLGETTSSDALNFKATNQLGTEQETNQSQLIAIDEYKNIKLAPTHFGIGNVVTEKIKIILGVDELPSEKPPLSPTPSETPKDVLA